MVTDCFRLNWSRVIARSSILFFVFFQVAISPAFCESSLYTYTIKEGDNAWDISRLFCGKGSLYKKILKINNIKNVKRLKPGNKILVPTDAPVNALKDYLTAVYSSDFNTAYSMFSSETRARYSRKDLDSQMGEITFFDLGSLKLISDSLKDNLREVRIRARMKNGGGSWIFSLVWEEGRWLILIEDMNITLGLD